MDVASSSSNKRKRVVKVKKMVILVKAVKLGRSEDLQGQRPCIYTHLPGFSNIILIIADPVRVD